MSSTSLADPPSPAHAYASPPVTIVLTVILLLFFFIGFFSIYFCRCLMQNLLLTWHISHNPSNTPENPSDVCAPNPGLDPLIIATFPTFTYSSVKEYRREKVGLECAICLCEFEDDNDLRLLPICCHVFHQECIDLWLESHKSCPFCRRALDTPPEKALNIGSAHVSGTLRQDSIPEHESLQDTYTINIKDENEHEKDASDLHKGGRVTALSSGSEVTLGSDLAEKFARSKSTGHSIVRKGGGGGGEEEDRFTLRLPEHVQAKLLRGHQPTRSCTTFGEFKSKTSAGNGGFGEVSTGDDNKDKINIRKIVQDQPLQLTSAILPIQLEAGVVRDLSLYDHFFKNVGGQFCKGSGEFESLMNQVERPETNCPLPSSNCPPAFLVHKKSDLST